MQRKYFGGKEASPPLVTLARRKYTMNDSPSMTQGQPQTDESWTLGPRPSLATVVINLTPRGHCCLHIHTRQGIINFLTVKSCAGRPLSAFEGKKPQMKRSRGLGIMFQYAGNGHYSIVGGANIWTPVGRYVAPSQWGMSSD